MLFKINTACYYKNDNFNPLHKLLLLWFIMPIKEE